MSAVPDECQQHDVVSAFLAFSCDDCEHQPIDHLHRHLHFDLQISHTKSQNGNVQMHRSPLCSKEKTISFKHHPMNLNSRIIIEVIFPIYVI